jgi:hypothetical protein
MEMLLRYEKQLHVRFVSAVRTDMAIVNAKEKNIPCAIFVYNV